MYRTVALLALQHKVNLDDDGAVTSIAKEVTFDFPLENGQTMAAYSVQGKPFIRLGKEIRTPEVSMAASRIAKLKMVRQEMVRQQQQLGERLGAIVEGRDAGTVIFPQAPYKFFMTASDDERAKRRYLELKERLGDQAPSLEVVHREMVQRDAQDSQRAESPLKPAADAEIIDTTGMPMPDVLSLLIARVGAKRAK